MVTCKNIPRRNGDHKINAHHKQVSVDVILYAHENFIFLRLKKLAHITFISSFVSLKIKKIGLRQQQH